MKRWILVAWALTMGLAAFAIGGRERLLAHGDTIYLRLAPVDPRSLMQGDYMALNFAIGTAIHAALDKQAGALRRDGIAVIRTDSRGEASFVRLHRGEALVQGEHLLRFQAVPSRWGRAQVQVSTDAWFFQEGQSERFAKARYGAFRVDAGGEALLEGLRGEDLKPL